MDRHVGSVHGKIQDPVRETPDEPTMTLIVCVAEAREGSKTSKGFEADE